MEEPELETEWRRHVTEERRIEEAIESICNNILRAREVDEVACELRDEG